MDSNSGQWKPGSIDMKARQWYADTRPNGGCREQSGIWDFWKGADGLTRRPAIVLSMVGLAAVIAGDRGRAVEGLSRQGEGELERLRNRKGRDRQVVQRLPSGRRLSCW